jgi:hypothetical protein
LSQTGIRGFTNECAAVQQFILPSEQLTLPRLRASPFWMAGRDPAIQST